MLPNRTKRFGQLWILIYPNPSDGYVTIDVSEMNNATVRVIDMGGKTVFEEAVAFRDQKEILKMELPPQLYLMEISDGSQVFTRRLLIE